MARPTSQERFYREAMEWFNDLLNTLAEISEKYAEELREKLNIIAESTIEDFYDDYIPSGYRRIYDIYNTYKIDVELDQFEIVWDIDYSPDYMKYHDGLKEYLFDIVFMQGWHGGADKGSGHPEPGTPWYRNLAMINKSGEYYEDYDPSIFWLRRAEHSAAPYEVVTAKVDEYTDVWERQYIGEIRDFLKKKLKEFRVILLKKSKGGNC